MPDLSTVRAASDDTPAWRPPKPGTQLKDGKLYRFMPGSITVFGPPWPDPRAWVKTPQRPAWRGCWPTLPFAPACAGIRERSRTGAWEQMSLFGPGPISWFDPVPDRILQLLARFGRNDSPAPVPWGVLNLLARVPGAADLVESAPALAVALAFPGMVRGVRPAKRWRTARRLVRLKRRDALAWLGFDASKATARLVARIPPEAATTGNLWRFQAATRYPDTRRLLAHAAPRITTGVLALTTSALRRSVSARLLAEVASDPAELTASPTASLLVDLLRMLGVTQADPGLVLRSRRHLRALHDDVAVGRTTALLGLAEVRFPDPPILPTEWFQPLTTTWELAKEGKHMHHCVASYAPQVLAGTSYIYKVGGPAHARATVELTQTKAGWQVAQVHGPHNTAVGLPTQIAIRDHLALSQRLGTPSPRLSLRQAIENLRGRV